MQVVADQDIGSGAEALFAEMGFQLSVQSDYHAWQQADALILNSQQPLPDAFLADPGKVRVIATLATAHTLRDLPALTRAGIPVLKPRRLETDSAADWVIWRLLDNARNRPGGGIELKNKTLGFLGFGPLAGHIARRAQGFGMTLVYYDPELVPSRAKAYGCTPADRVDVMILSDFVCVTLPLTPSTKGLIGRDDIRLMREGTSLIHMADPQVLRWEELRMALDFGYLDHFIIDLPPEEGALAEALTAYPQARVSVNEAANTLEAYLGNVEELAQDMRRILEGEAPERAVNVPRSSSRRTRDTRRWLQLAGLLGEFMGQRLHKLPRQGMLECNGTAWEAGEEELLAVVLAGLAKGNGESGINHISSRLWAAEQNLTLEVTPYAAADSPELTLSFPTDRGIRRVSGRVIHGEITLTRVDGYHLIAYPTTHILLIPHTNRPGMIGLVGTLLGEWGININGMVLGHKRTDKDTALMWIVLGKPLSEDVLARIRALPHMGASEYIHLEMQD